MAATLTNNFTFLHPASATTPCDDLGWGERSRQRETDYATEVDDLYARRYGEPDFDQEVNDTLDFWGRDPLTASCEDHAGWFTCNEPDDLPY